ncbi:hypothetical protein Sste5346_005194 [Sporothrix stenoceras]|uniref:MARVEL domain-containing protein n=1 Tax=Sporothrix stenoceras TaxID=5173 RepID=A0ABR3Z6D0_9PEZI
MASSNNKDEFGYLRSLTSASDIEANLKPNPSSQQLQSAPPPSATTTAAQIRDDACPYDPVVRGAIPFYTFGRATNMILSLVVFWLGFVAVLRYDKDDWMNAIITPACAVFGFSCYDLYSVLRLSCRFPPHVRILYDGIFYGTGMAVASGFLTVWAVDAASDIGYSLSAPILVCLYTTTVIQYSICIEAVIEVIRMRRGT